MAGVMAISDFSHMLMAYPNVNGAVNTVSMRSVYGNSSPVPGGLKPYTGTPAATGSIKPKRAAHTYIYATDNAGIDHVRRIPCDPQFPSKIVDISGLTIDGLTGWTYGGYTGQRDRSTP